MADDHHPGSIGAYRTNQQRGDRPLTLLSLFPWFRPPVLCVKFCKGGHGWLESCGLAELNFLVLFEIVHIEIAVGFEPVLVGLDG